ncbi:ribosome maturation factor RimM [Microseira wollei]|uniref:Ribosome maturation factor RimM n=1 Tax=Microseira wollei NIES-4236 TaxID=2530354 RepID=A0AAV3XNC0_9CYAN|nr:ribosome maturation factor RimM [Microseira wollei]GET43818.1 16S rRNA processing protein RimM [Microseira wollei NIES-4236]
MTNPKSAFPGGSQGTSQNPQSEDWIEIGTIVAPQGLKGEVRVYSNSDFPERFEEPGQRWLLRPNETELETVELLSGRYIPGKGVYVIKLAGVEDCNQAEALRGCKLMVPASDRPPLEEDEYHVRDLIGLEVFNQLTGESLGIVVDLIPAGNDLLEVQLHQAESEEKEEDLPDTSNAKNEQRKSQPTTVLIPFVKEIVPVVDLEQKRIEIAPPPGLLEL